MFMYFIYIKRIKCVKVAYIYLYNFGCVYRHIMDTYKITCSLQWKNWQIFCLTRHSIFIYNGFTHTTRRECFSNVNNIKNMTYKPINFYTIISRPYIMTKKILFNDIVNFLLFFFSSTCRKILKISGSYIIS